MTEPVRFIVPGPPVGKGRPRATRQGRLYTPEKTRSYEAVVKMSAAAVMVGRDLLRGPIDLGIDVVCEMPASWPAWKRGEALAGRVHPTTRPDSDNVLKAVADGLNGVVWVDDAQVVSLSLRKIYGTAPCVRVVVLERDGLTAQSTRRAA